jgi:hypothetical protein
MSDFEMKQSTRNEVAIDCKVASTFKLCTAARGAETDSYDIPIFRTMVAKEK